MDIYFDKKQWEKGAWISITAYVCLSMLKLFVGNISHSEVLIADGFNNSTDIILSFAVLIGLRISRKPPDDDHKYGHSRAENIAALFAAFIMFAVGMQILVQSVKKSFTGVEAPDLIAAWIALFGAIVMFAVYLYNLKLAKKTNSQAIMAAAMDNRSDALVSVGAFIGIMGAQFGIPLLDPFSAIVVGFIICKSAWDIFRNATHALTDGFDEKKLNEFKTTIETIPGVESIKDIRARLHGNVILVDVTIEVNRYLNIVESHDISVSIEKQMLKKHKIPYIHVHIEPVGL